MPRPPGADTVSASSAHCAAPSTGTGSGTLVTGTLPPAHWARDAAGRQPCDHCSSSMWRRNDAGDRIRQASRCDGDNAVIFRAPFPAPRAAFALRRRHALRGAAGPVPLRRGIAAVSAGAAATVAGVASTATTGSRSFRTTPDRRFPARGTRSCVGTHGSGRRTTCRVDDTGRAAPALPRKSRASHCNTRTAHSGMPLADNRHSERRQAGPGGWKSRRLADYASCVRKYGNACCHFSRVSPTARSRSSRLPVLSCQRELWIPPCAGRSRGPLLRPEFLYIASRGPSNGGARPAGVEHLTEQHAT